VQAQIWEVGAKLGTSGYMGDLNTENPFQFSNLGGELAVKYNFNPTWGIKTSLGFARVEGSDLKSAVEQRRNRALSFQSNVWEISSVAEFNFFGFKPGRGNIAYTPYVYAGLGAMHYDPYVYMREQGKLKLRDLSLEVDQDGNPIEYGRLAVIIPFGIGFKYNLNGPFSIGADLGYRIAFTDHLDNVGAYYKAVSTNPELDYLADPSGHLMRNQGKLRGDGRPYDAYMTAGFTITYTFISQKCYWW